MVTIIPGLPVRPPNAPAAATPEEILKQPSSDAAKDQPTDIKNVPVVDIDPGVFNTMAVKLGLYRTPDPEHPDQEPPPATGNITKGTYAGTQAALTHAYSRIERSFESYFDVLQVESTLPRFTEIPAKQNIYQWSAYPKNADGSIAIYPPHLEHIPAQDDVSTWSIFNKLGLLEAGAILKQVIPDSFESRTALFFQKLLDIHNGNILGAPDQGSAIKAYEIYNKQHRKSGTDIESGQNIGLLPDWFSDRRFADQSLTGANPTTIEKIPDDLLTEFMEAAVKGGYDYWAQNLLKIDRASLFVQDCRYFRKAFGAQPDEELQHTEIPNNANWACATVTMFQLYPDGKLHPIAIVCDYKDAMANSVTIFNQRKSPADSSVNQDADWPWRYAKTCAQVSDWIRHEIGIHLTRAHMIEEALIVATHRNIPMDHIVFTLLEPHWLKTLSLNAAARLTLVPQIIKDLVGVKPNYLYSFIRYEFENFDFVGSYVPNDLERRGFPSTEEGLAGDKYKNYAYAKNMVSMWQCIRSYVMEMLRTTYDESTGDEKVNADPAIKAWCQDVQTNGWIKTFPNIETVDQLCDAITMCIHIAAPFHSAVNYLQNFYQAFVLAKPPSLCSALPRSLNVLKTYAERDLVAAMPIGRQRQWLLSVQIPWLLSFKVGSAEGDRSLITFAHSQWFAHRADQDPEGKQVAAISEELYMNLQKLKAEFAQTSRNMEEGAIPYNVLDPDNTAVSILI